MKPKKSLGQNFLKDRSTILKIVKCGELTNNDIVLEIGPGTGILTEEILKKEPSHLIVVEKDKDLSALLKKKFGNRIEIINKDILSCYSDFIFDKPIKVFGNLPYNISTKILTSFIKLKNLKENFNKFIFIFQKEVADRILADENSSNYGRISIMSAWKTSTIKIMDINPNFFFPKPKVISTLLVVNPKNSYENLINSKNLEHITNIFFNQRRKMIKKPMKQLFTNYELIANELKLDLNLRPQKLSVLQYIEICKTYEKLI